MFGLLNLHKPSGPTSRDCVNELQRRIRPFKTGHAGTLDPIASGVLVILVGQATRLTDEFHRLDKEYVGTFELGVSSPSVDTETEVTKLTTVRPFGMEDLRSATQRFLGHIEQQPPIYSAIRIGGKRAHELARIGQSAEMPTRRVHIREIEVIEFNYPTMKLRIVCGTGTYIRSLGRDIARSLNNDVVMTALIRTRIGPLSIQDALPLEELQSAEQIHRAIRAPQESLTVLPVFTLPPETLERFKNGKKVPADTMHPIMPTLNDLTLVQALDNQGRLRAILEKIERDGEILWKTAKFFND